MVGCIYVYKFPQCIHCTAHSVNFMATFRISVILRARVTVRVRIRAV